MATMQAISSLLDAINIWLCRSIIHLFIFSFHLLQRVEHVFGCVSRCVSLPKWTEYVSRFIWSISGAHSMTYKRTIACVSSQRQRRHRRRRASSDIFEIKICFTYFMYIQFTPPNDKKAHWFFDANASKVWLVVLLIELCHSNKKLSKE